MTIRWLAIGLLGLVLWSTTSQRVLVWTSEDRLYADAVAKAPLKPRPWVNLGMAYAHQGQHDLARAAYETALRLAEHPRRSSAERAAGRWYAAENVAALDRLEGLHRWLRDP